MEEKKEKRDAKQERQQRQVGKDKLQVNSRKPGTQAYNNDSKYAR